MQNYKSIFTYFEIGIKLSIYYSSDKVDNTLHMLKNVTSVGLHNYCLAHDMM